MFWPARHGHSGASGRSQRAASLCQDRSDFQASLLPQRIKGLSPEPRYIFVRSTVIRLIFQAEGLALDLTFTPHFHLLLLLGTVAAGCGWDQCTQPQLDKQVVRVSRFYVSVISWLVCGTLLSHCPVCIFYFVCK